MPNSSFLGLMAFFHSGKSFTCLAHRPKLLHYTEQKTLFCINNGIQIELPASHSLDAMHLVNSLRAMAV